MTSRRFFSGTSLERALLDAAGYFGIEPEELEFTKLEKRGVGSRGKVVIKVDPDSPRKQAAADEADTPADEAPAEAAEVSAEQLEPAAVAEAEDEAEDGDGDEVAPLEAELDEVENDEVENEGAGHPEDEVSDRPAEERTEEPDSNGADSVSEEPPDAMASDSGEGASATSAPEPQEPASGEMAALPRSAAEARRAWPKASGPVEEAARRWTESLLRVASLDLAVEIYERNGEVEVHLSGADAEVAIEDGGEVLRAMQHLLPRLLLGTLGHSVQCRVDCNDFRELHEEGLRTQALRAATEAMAAGGEFTLEPMHPADRRIVHLTLADNKLVRTESLGRGFFKRVLVRVA